MKRIFGYCRISTNKQSIERQERNILESYPTAKIYKETYTGTRTIGRIEFNKMLKNVVSGDVIIFDSVSRMSRNAEDGVTLYFDLFNKGIELVFLKEPHINTVVYKQAIANNLTETENAIANEYIKATNKVIKMLAKNQIILAFEQAQKEIDDLHQRTKEGIETARRNGKQIGQVKGAKLNVKKAVKAKQIIKKHSKDFGGTLTDKECLAITKLSRNTYYKYKRELLNDI